MNHHTFPLREGMNKVENLVRKINGRDHEDRPRTDEPPDFDIGQNILLKYNGHSSVVVIPEGVTVIGENAFEDNLDIKVVVIPEGVTAIRYEAFYCCENLTSAVLPSTLEMIEREAFAFTGLTGIVLPEGLKKIGCDAFTCCPFTSLAVPKSVELIGMAAFSRCKNLSHVVVDENTLIRPQAFEGCTALADKDGFVIVNEILFLYTGHKKSVYIPSTVKILDGTSFYQCEGVEEIHIPRTVKYMSQYFILREDTSIQRICVPRGYYKLWKRRFSTSVMKKVVAVRG